MRIGVRGCWYVKISEIINQKAIYKYGDEGFNASCGIYHTPMKWNFWHFSIRWFLEKEQCYWHELDNKHKKKGWYQRLAHETRSIIRKFAKTDKPLSMNLPPSCYMINE